MRATLTSAFEGADNPAPSSKRKTYLFLLLAARWAALINIGGFNRYVLIHKVFVFHHCILYSHFSRNLYPDLSSFTVGTTTCS